MRHKNELISHTKLYKPIYSYINYDEHDVQTYKY